MPKVTIGEDIPLPPGAEVARRENCWRIADKFMQDWNGGNRFTDSTLFDKTLELARFIAGEGRCVT